MNQVCIRSFNNNKPATPRAKRSASPIEALKSSSQRPSSANLISKCLYKIIGEAPRCHGSLSKKITNLEKRQDQWKERALIWDKEKKAYQSTLENIMKNTSEYYKDHLQTWSESKGKKIMGRNSEGSANALLDWIRKQPDDCTVLQIKEMLNERSQFSEDLGNMNSENKTTDNCIKELIEKNEELSISLLDIETELKKKAEGLESLKEKFQQLKSDLSDKDSQLLEEKTLNEALMARITELTANDSFRMPRKLIELENELESKSLEIVLLQTRNTQLEANLDQYKTSSSIYISTIQELQSKLHSMRLTSFKLCSASSSLSSLPSLCSLSDPVSSSTQTDPLPPTPSFSPSSSHLTCMASAIEELLSVISKR